MARPRELLGLRLYYFLGFVALGIYAPAFPRWLEAHGIRGLELGIVAATSPVMGLLSPPLFGWIADRTGLRRAVVMATTVLSAASVAALAMVAGRDAAPPFLLMLGCASAFAFFRAPTVSLADMVVLEAGVAYGPSRLWGSLGFLVAAVVAGRTLDPTAPALLEAIAVAYVAAALAAISLPASRALRGEEAVVERDRAVTSEVARDPALGWLLACALCLEAAHSAYDLCFSLRLRDVGIAPAAGGVLWALGVLAEVVFFVSGERLLARFGAGRLLVVGCGAIAVRMVALAEVDRFATLAPLQVLHALTFGATWTALMRILKERAPDGMLGSLRGALSATVAVGGALGMLAWGTAYPGLGGPATFRAAAVLGAIATLLAASCARRLVGPVTDGATACPSER